VGVIGNNFCGHADQASLVGRQRFVLGFGSFGGRRDAGLIVYLDGRTAGQPGPERRSPTTLGVMGPAADPGERRASRAGEHGHGSLAHLQRGRRRPGTDLPEPLVVRMLSHFEPGRVPPLADGSRALRLRLW